MSPLLQFYLLCCSVLKESGRAVQIYHCSALCNAFRLSLLVSAEDKVTQCLLVLGVLENTGKVLEYFVSKRAGTLDRWID